MKMKEDSSIRKSVIFRSGTRTTAHPLSSLSILLTFWSECCRGLCFQRAWTLPPSAFRLLRRRPVFVHGCEVCIQNRQWRRNITSRKVKLPPITPLSFEPLSPLNAHNHLSLAQLNPTQPQLVITWGNGSTPYFACRAATLAAVSCDPPLPLPPPPAFIRRSYCSTSSSVDNASSSEMRFETWWCKECVGWIGWNGHWCDVMWCSEAWCRVIDVTWYDGNAMCLE